QLDDTLCCCRRRQFHKCCCRQSTSTPHRLTARFPVRQLLELFVLQSQHLGRLTHAVRSSQFHGRRTQRLRNRQFFPAASDANLQNVHSVLADQLVRQRLVVALSVLRRTTGH